MKTLDQRFSELEQAVIQQGQEIAALKQQFTDVVPRSGTRTTSKSKPRKASE